MTRPPEAADARQGGGEEGRGGGGGGGGGGEGEGGGVRGRADPAASRAFYEAALEPLGYRVLLEFGPVVGMGEDRRHCGSRRPKAARTLATSRSAPT